MVSGLHVVYCANQFLLTIELAQFYPNSFKQYS